MADFGAGAGKIQDDPRAASSSAGTEGSAQKTKTHGPKSKQHRSQPERASSVQSWDNLSNKIT